MAPVETCYASNGGVRIAYQVLGEGAFDLVFVPGLVSNLDTIWDDPDHAHFCRRLAEFSRLILFDKRGTGLSDRHAGIPGIEERMDDVAAVMEAAGSRRAAIMGVSEGGKMALLFAATYPERVRALVLYGAFAQSPTRAWPPEQVNSRFALIERAWGTGLLPPSVAPSRAADQAFRQRWMQFERQGASPAAAGQLLRMDHEVDVTQVLAAVRVPTLVIHRDADQRIGVEHGRHLAAHLPGATYAELPGPDHIPHIGDIGQVVTLMQGFLQSTPAEAAPARAFATVLSAKGDAPTLGEVGRCAAERYRGRELGSGDGRFLAAFDGPARAVRCALAIAEAMRQEGAEMRCGLHCGEIELGGNKAGATGAAATRLAKLAGANETIVSGVLYDLLAGTGLRFAEREAQDDFRLYTVCTGG